MNKHAALNLKADKIAAACHRPAPRFRAQACDGTGGLHRRHARAGRHCCMATSASSTVAHGTITSIDLSAVRAAPGVVDVLTAKDVPGENDISPTGRHDEPVLADGKVAVPRPADLLRHRRDARAGAARLPAGEDRVRGTAGDHRRRRARPVNGKLVTPPLTLKRGDAAGGDRQGAAPAKGPDADRRPGPFLPRRPDRLGHPRRGRRRHRLFLDAASERGAAHGRACARRAVAMR